MDIIPTPKKHNVIFDSQILTKLMKCPRDANMTFNMNYRPIGGKSNALEIGSIAHTILEFYNKAKISGSRRTDAIEIGFEAGREYLRPYDSSNKYVTDKDHKGILNTPMETQSKPKRIGYQYVFSTMEQYFDFWRNEPNWTPLYVEHVLKDVIYEDDNIRVMWKAKFDLISDTPSGLIPTDHKTMSQTRDTISLNNQFMGQCVLVKGRQVEIDKIGWQTSLPPHEKFLRPMISYSMDRLTEWMKEIVPQYAYNLIAYQEADNYPANFSQCEDKYGYCNFKRVCEADRNMRQIILEREYELVKEWDIQND